MAMTCSRMVHSVTSDTDGQRSAHRPGQTSVDASRTSHLRSEIHANVTRPPGPLEDPVLRRLLLILVFAVGLTGPNVVAEQSADASVTRHVATRSERVVRSVTAAATVALTRPAMSVATYWQGNADARVTLAFSSGGAQFGPPH